MSRQLSLDSFFKSKSTGFSGLPKSIMNSDKKCVKRNLSLRKHETPSKSPKRCEDKNSSGINQVINLCSDDEFTSPKSTCTFGTPNDTSDSSQATVIYSPSSPKDTLLTSQIACADPQTPSASLRVRSPRSINKYFSPSKKRVLFRKSPVERNLDKHWRDVNLTTADELFNEACKGMDDKTIFLLKIVYKCSRDESLMCLLNEPSQNLLDKCLHIQKPGMMLVCRLFWFKGLWYKEDKLRLILTRQNKDFDKSLLQKVLKTLLDCGLITSCVTNGDVSMAFEDYTKVLDHNDLKEICKQLKLKVNTKQDAVEALKIYSKRSSISNFYTGKTGTNSNRLLKIMSTKAGTCYRLSELAQRTLYRLYVLMYLGIDYSLIREKKLELTLIYDKIKRETYPIEDDYILDNASVVFKNNEEFERYIKALTIYEDFLMETNVNKKCDIVVSVFNVYKNYTEEEILRCKSFPVWLRRFTHLNLYIKILELGIQDLKKESKYTLVLDILSSLISQDSFRQHKKAHWIAEKALVLHKINQYDEAAKVLLEGFKSNINEEAKDVMRTRAKIVAKQTSQDALKTELLAFADKENILEKNLRGVHIHKQPMDRTQSKGKLKYETRTPDGRIVQDVEEFCLSHYIQSGEFTDGKHSEGRMVTTIFFLLFWDIIYSKPQNCPGIFLTRYQKYPLDLFCESFYSNRKKSIDDRLKLLGSMPIQNIVDMMQEIWFARPETEHSGINREWSWEHVRAVSQCLGAAGLAALCRRLAADYRYTHSGFPDLTLWNRDTMQIRFVEVKSDADKPSIKQIQWMHYLQENGIDTEFCYVGVNTTRSKARAH